MHTLNTKDLSISKREDARQLWQNDINYQLIGETITFTGFKWITQERSWSNIKDKSIYVLNIIWPNDSEAFDTNFILIDANHNRYIIKSSEPIKFN